MKNKKAEEVIKRLQEASKTFGIELLGNEQNQLDGFSIFLHCKGGFRSSKEGVYWGIGKDTIKLLKEAEIKFKILE